MPINLVIDRGNTLTKAALFKEYAQFRKFNEVKGGDIQRIIDEHKVENVLISNVGKPFDQKELQFEGVDSIIELSHLTSLPIQLNYTTPETLGKDRIAAAAGAHYLYPEAQKLIIDIGSCIKYDFVDSNGVFEGGAISPGINFRYRALNDYTANLPLLKDLKVTPIIGKSTSEAIESGVINGIISEINGFCDQYRQHYDRLNIILCGGDTIFFETKIKGDIFAVQDLVMIGLNCILMHNI